MGSVEPVESSGFLVGVLFAEPSKGTVITVSYYVGARPGTPFHFAVTDLGSDVEAAHT
jgi:hypothetical protein